MLALSRVTSLRPRYHPLRHGWTPQGADTISGSCCYNSFHTEGRCASQNPMSPFTSSSSVLLMLLWCMVLVFWPSQHTLHQLLMRTNPLHLWRSQVPLVLQWGSYNWIPQLLVEFQQERGVLHRWTFLTPDCYHTSSSSTKEDLLEQFQTSLTGSLWP